jgi:membrane protein DedA with SNARE-associated domain
VVDLREAIGHWGYLAIVLSVLAGNIGLPVPEETALALGGYLAWRGTLRFPVVVGLGVASAILGDNAGYWLGRRYGLPAIERHGRRLWLTPERLAAVRAFVTQHGALAVFAARFLPGLRFAAGPLAGASGLSPGPFLAANALGAACYVPLAAGAGYAVGYGLGERIEAIRHALGRVEHAVGLLLVAATLIALAWRAIHGRRAASR